MTEPSLFGTALPANPRHARRTPRAPQPPTTPVGLLNLSEDDWQALVIDTARWHRWRICHIRNVRVGHGRAARWLVPYQGDGGLPDLTLAKAGRVLLVELKTETGPYRPGQREWLAAAGPNGYCWRPRDWPTVQAVLRGDPDADTVGRLFKEN